MKRKEHRSCSCPACRRGAASGYGKYVHRAVARKLRRQYRRMLARGGEDTIIVGTPYTG